MRPLLTTTLLTLILSLLTTQTHATASDKYDPYNQCGAPFCGSAAVGAVGAGAVVRSISEQTLESEGGEKVGEREKEKEEGKVVVVVKV